VDETFHEFIPPLAANRGFYLLPSVVQLAIAGFPLYQSYDLIIMTSHLEFYQYLPQCISHLGDKVLAVASLKKILQTCEVKLIGMA
jgi:hypothetical protein